MLSGKIMAAAAGRPTTPPFVFEAHGTSFNGSSQYMRRSNFLTGVADSGVGIASFWVKRTRIGVQESIITSWIAGDQHFRIFFDSSNRIQTQMASGSNAMRTFTTNTYTSTSAWYHVLISWNTNAAPGSRTVAVYVNGTLATNNFSTNTGVAFTVPYASSLNDWHVATNSGTIELLSGALGEVYFAPGQTLDLSVQANREKFALDGEPVSLGADGSLPTGTAPALYLRNPNTSFGTNSGTGGDFTITAGPLTDAGEPSYFVAKAAAFNGTNQDLLILSGLGGSTSTFNGTLSFWVKPNTLSSNINIMGSASPGVGSIRIASDGGGWVHLRGPASENFVINFVAGSFVAGVWNHVLCSWNTSGGAGSKTTYLYVNNVNKKGTVNDTSAGFSMNWNNGSMVAICSTLSSLYLNGSLAEFFLHVGAAANFSNASERDKFSVSGKPAYLGETGELPFGSAPMIYLKDPFTTYNNNSGTGVDFTLRNGPLADGGSVSY